MAAPTTKIEIMSNASVVLGQEPFTTIDDKNKFAVSAQKMYDMIVDSELSKTHWKFCKQQKQLSLVAGFNPDFAEFSSAYDLPADFLSMVRIYPMVHYQIFERRILTSTKSTLKIEYNANVPVSYWWAPFKEYIVYALANAMAPGVTENQNLVKLIQEERQRTLSTAMFVDAQNAPNRSIQHNPWIEVRGRGRSGWGGGGYGY